jgi:uracil phosphoribosyltransferase
MLRSGLGLWEGARTVLPNALVAHVGYGSDAGMAPGSPAPTCYLDGLPAAIGTSTGVLVFEPLVGGHRPVGGA